MANELIHETSPYLLQHAHNPVDWHAWNRDALDKAMREDKPIFLSIGYAACHWCHVMEHESFEDEETAALLNRDFISIKVDREERPDLDSIYMNAVVALTGSGGWPMSVFLTANGKPFYGGTYFPNTRRYGMPSFKDVLNSVADAWKNRREQIVNGSARIADALAQNDFIRDSTDSAPLARETLDRALIGIQRGFDWTNGGWSGAPKFPQPMTLEFLIRTYTHHRDEFILKMIRATLTKMARGGMYDQLGGGFHRYSTDDHWLVPHFEKMLYDNAQLARVYLHAWQVTRDDFYRRVTEETLDYVAREMTHARGGFFSTQDADSEGHEGKFFVWSAEEIRSILETDAKLFLDAYGVSENGNFEGQNILFAAQELDVTAALHKTTIAAVEQSLAVARQKLFAAREKRIKPARDEKILTAWNGMMLAAFAEAARVFKRDDYRAIAERNAEFLIHEMREKHENQNKLLRSWKDGVAKLNAYLEDYASLAEGLLALYETTFDEKYFIAARELADTMLARFADPRGGFFDTSDDHEQLVTRPKDLQDNATPSGNAMAVTILLKLAAYTSDARYADAADRALRAIQPALAQHPTAFAQWLCALDFALGAPKEIAIVGDDAQELLETVFADYRPNQVVAWARGEESRAIPLLEGRARVTNRATAYVCQNFACKLPVNDAAALAGLL
ncbi:MAG: thioredoxin domain-containing protein [Chloroflexi bacterium]|nr:thioredoxin domain-containing protein [Chloroflexota bacterium]